MNQTIIEHDFFSSILGAVQKVSSLVKKIDRYIDIANLADCVIIDKSSLIDCANQFAESQIPGLADAESAIQASLTTNIDCWQIVTTGGSTPTFSYCYNSPSSVGGFDTYYNHLGTDLNIADPVLIINDADINNYKRITKTILDITISVTTQVNFKGSWDVPYNSANAAYYQYLQFENFNSRSNCYYVNSVNYACIPNHNIESLSFNGDGKLSVNYALIISLIPMIIVSSNFLK
jgi:hypothetical protein